MLLIFVFTQILIVLLIIYIIININTVINIFIYTNIINDIKVKTCFVFFIIQTLLVFFSFLSYNVIFILGRFRNFA